MNEIIIILGLPGSGKSTLAKRISKELDYGLYDFDDHIPNFMKEKMSKGQIIIEEDRLKCTEILIKDLKKLSEKRKIVCACVLTKDSHRRLVLSQLKNTKIFYLDVPYNTLLERLGDRENHFLKKALLERINNLNEAFSTPYKNIKGEQKEEAVFLEFKELLKE